MNERRQTLPSFFLFFSEPFRIVVDCVMLYLHRPGRFVSMRCISSLSFERSSALFAPFTSHIRAARLRSSRAGSTRSCALARLSPAVSRPVFASTPSSSSESAMSGAPPGTVSLQDLSAEQIAQVRSQLEQVRALRLSSPHRRPLTPLIRLDPLQELKHLTTAFGDLKSAQSKFMACMESLDSVKPANKGAPSRNAAAAFPADLLPTRRQEGPHPAHQLAVRARPDKGHGKRTRRHRDRILR